MRDITLGQYVITKSLMHSLDPRIKILSLCFVIAFLFVAGDFVSLGIMAVLVFAAMLCSGVRIGKYFGSLKFIIAILIFTGLCNVFFGSGGTEIWSWGIFNISTGGIRTAIFVVVRIMLLVLASSVLTFTTSPGKLTTGLEKLLYPLSKIKVPVNELAMMATIALRFIPTLLEEADKIISAQKARGAPLDGGVAKRVKGYIPVIIPLFVSSFRRAFDLATAMEARCYIGGNKRTSMNKLKLYLCDYVCFALVLLCCAGVLVLRITGVIPH